MSIDPEPIEGIEEHSFGPVEGPVVDALSHIKHIPKMNASANATLLKSRKESIGIEPLEVIVENL